MKVDVETYIVPSNIFYRIAVDRMDVNDALKDNVAEEDDFHNLACSKSVVDYCYDA